MENPQCAPRTSRRNHCRAVRPHGPCDAKAFVAGRKNGRKCKCATRLQRFNRGEQTRTRTPCLENPSTHDFLNTPSEIIVDNVLEHLLPAALVGGCLPFFESVLLQLGEAGP